MSWRQDWELCSLADNDATNDLRGRIRFFRRTINRSWLKRNVIYRPRVFCQNSGGCGSSYFIQFLQANGIGNAFHEKTPDFNQLGIDHYELGLPKRRLVRLLRYTRHDCDVEANNRLFSMGQELATAFPNARFIHLHRSGHEAVQSAMSKPNVEQYLKENLRFQGRLAGPHSASPFERVCHYWSNMNKRIMEDLEQVARFNDQESLSLRFKDLISGNVDTLEDFFAIKFSTRMISPVNEGRVRDAGRFPVYSDWTNEQKAMFERVCSETMARLGY